MRNIFVTLNIYCFELRTLVSYLIVLSCVLWFRTLLVWVAYSSFVPYCFELRNLVSYFTVWVLYFDFVPDYYVYNFVHYIYILDRVVYSCGFVLCSYAKRLTLFDFISGIHWLSYHNMYMIYVILMKLSNIKLVYLYWPNVLFICFEYEHKPIHLRTVRLLMIHIRIRVVNVLFIIVLWLYHVTLKWLLLMISPFLK